MGSWNRLPVGRGSLSISHRPKRTDIPQLSREGCGCVVTLLSEREDALTIGRWVEHQGMTWIWLAVPNGNYPQGEIRQILVGGLLAVVAQLDQAKWVHVHCSAGIHRTGMFTYGLVRYLGHSPESGLELVGELRRVTRDGLAARHIRWGDELVGDP